MQLEIADAILERVYDVVTENGVAGTTTLRLWRPYFDPKTESSLQWRCPYQMTGLLGTGKILYGSGMDAVHALLVCLVLAGIRIREYNKDGTRITLFGEDDLGLSLLNLPDPNQPANLAWDTADNPFRKAFDEFFRNFKP